MENTGAVTGLSHKPQCGRARVSMTTTKDQPNRCTVVNTSVVSGYIEACRSDRDYHFPSSTEKQDPSEEVSGCTRLNEKMYY